MAEHVQKLVRTEYCSLGSVRRVAAMLDLDDGFLKSGGPLPRGWQFFLLASGTARSTVREDGFPGFGIAFEGLHLPSLVIVGREVRFVSDIAIESRVRRETTLAKVKAVGGAGSVLVTVAHELYDDLSGALLLLESQTYLFRHHASYQSAAAPDVVPAFDASYTPDDLLLFQYSALGFNSHKIHLDRNFACAVEGFPDLVVNGGLSMLLLTERVRRGMGLQLAGLSASHVSPLFSNRPIHVTSRTDDRTVLLDAHDDAGRLALRIKADIEQ